MTDKRTQTLVITSLFNSKRTGKPLFPSQLRSRLGITSDQLAAALDALRAAGLIDAQSRLTFAGLAVAVCLRRRGPAQRSNAKVSRLTSQARAPWSSGRLAA